MLHNIERWIILWQGWNSLHSNIQCIPPSSLQCQELSMYDSVPFRRCSSTLCSIVCSPPTLYCLFPPPSCLAPLLVHLVSLLSVFNHSVLRILSFDVCPSFSVSLTFCPCHSHYICSSSCVFLLSALCLALLISWKLSSHCSVPVGPALAILCNTLMAPKGSLAHTYIQIHKKSSLLLSYISMQMHSVAIHLVANVSAVLLRCFMMHIHFDIHAFVHMCLGFKGVFHCVVGGPLTAFSPHLGMLQYHSLIGLKLSWQEIHLRACVYACVCAKRDASGWQLN